MKIYLSALLGILLIACNALASIAPTPTPDPATIDLAPYLIQEGDLPFRFSSSGLMTELPADLEGYNDIVNFGRRKIEFNGGPAGSVTVAIFQNADLADKAYADLAQILCIGSEEIEPICQDQAGIGEASSAYAVDSSGYNWAGLVFKRCRMIGLFLLVGEQDVRGVVDFARRVDQRLESIACL